MASYDDGLLWLVVAAIAVGSFLIRLSFVQLFGRLERVPPRVNRALRFVPAAVLTALFVPAFVSLDAGLVPTVEPSRLVAGFVGGAVAWRTGNIVWTLVAGMVALWVLTLLV
jgi:branched-subunit amino acid transport protein